MSETTNELEKLDITTLVDAFLHSLKRLWVIVLILSIGLGALSYFRTQSTYVPAYKAEATVAVYTSDDGTTINSRSAQQLGTVFPYILTSGVLKDVIMEEMGVTALPGLIKVINVEGTNLLTISVSSSDPNLSYQTLLSIIKNYPKVAEYVVGYTAMEIIDDSGIPSDSGKTIAVRGNALKGSAVGFAVGMGLVFMHMLLNRTVRTAKDVRAFSTVEHLGTLPVYKKKKRKDTASSISILEHNVQQDYLEAIRLIRTRIMRKLENNGHKVLMVTSSVPGEGKSTIAANLAISLSGKDKKVIIVDCDLRNPSLQEIFKVDKKHPTLLDVIYKKVSLEDALVSADNHGIQLNVLFGSPDNPTNHSEILGSQRMNEVIERLKKMADIVILDTPPSAMLVDAMLVAKYVDEAVYVIMADYARTSVIADGLRELKNAGIEISGFVLNGSKDSLGGYGYHSYGYGSHYYEYQEEDRKTSKKSESGKPVISEEEGKKETDKEIEEIKSSEKPGKEEVKIEEVKQEAHAESIKEETDKETKTEEGKIAIPQKEALKAIEEEFDMIQKDFKESKKQAEEQDDIVLKTPAVLQTQETEAEPEKKELHIPMRKVEEYKTRNDVVEEKKVSTEFVEEKIKETETESTKKEGKETLIFADTSEEKTKEKAVLAEEKPIKVSSPVKNAEGYVGRHRKRNQEKS